MLEESDHAVECGATLVVYHPWFQPTLRSERCCTFILSYNQECPFKKLRTPTNVSAVRGGEIYAVIPQKNSASFEYSGQCGEVDERESVLLLKDQGHNIEPT